MEKKSREFSIDDAARLAKSPAAQQLMAALQAHDADAMERVMSNAAAGNYTQVQQDLAKMLTSPEIQALLGG